MSYWRALRPGRLRGCVCCSLLLSSAPHPTQARILALGLVTLPLYVRAPLGVSPFANNYAIKPFLTTVSQVTRSTSVLLKSLTQTLSNYCPVDKIVTVYWNFEGIRMLSEVDVVHRGFSLQRTSLYGPWLRHVGGSGASSRVWLTTEAAEGSRAVE